MTISKHYCGTSLKSVSLMFAPEPCCEIPDGCCHDESITVKLELNYFVPLFAFDFTQLAIDLPATIELIQVKYPVYSSFVTTINTPPPQKIQTVLSRLQTYLL